PHSALCPYNDALPISKRSQSRQQGNDQPYPKYIANAPSRPFHTGRTRHPLGNIGQEYTDHRHRTYRSAGNHAQSDNNGFGNTIRSEEHTSELQSREKL